MADMATINLQTQKRRKQILAFCKNTPRSLSEISEILEMNKHTVRTGYLYPMVNEGLLTKTVELPMRKSNKFLTV